jgi:hypothetical protein
MTFTTIAIGIAVVVFVLARRIKGEHVRDPKKLFVLPLVVGLIGLQDVIHAKPNSIDIAVIAAGSVLSLGLGLLRGRLDKVSFVNGSPSMSWRGGSVIVFAVNVLAKLALDGFGVAAGGTSSALSSSILLSLGLAFLGEAVIVWLRAQSLGTGHVGTGQYRGAVQSSDRPTMWPPIR